MATLYITEFSGIGPDMTGRTPQTARLPAIVDQAITLSATSAQSAAFNAQTVMVRVQSDADCFILADSNPTATTSKMPLAAGSAEYFSVFPGLKIAGIAA